MLGRIPLLALIIILSIFGPLSTDMYLPGLPEMVDYFGTTESIMGMTLYVFMIALAVGVLVLGPVSDRYGRRPVLLASMTLYTVSSILCGMSTDIWVLIALRAVQAIGGAGAMCISVALTKDCFKGRDMTFALSITAIIGVIGPIMAPVLGTVLIETVGWRYTFWVPAVFSFVCLLMGLGISRDLPVNRSGEPLGEAMKEIGRIAKDGPFIAFTVMMTINLAAQLAYISVSSYVYQDGFGMSSSVYSLSLAATLVLGIFVMLAVQKASGRMGTPKVLCIILAMLAVSFVAMMLLGKAEWYWFLLTMVPCAAMTMFARSYGFDILMRQRDDGSGAVSSVLNFASFAFCCLGTFVASLSWGDHVDGILVCMAICIVTFSVLWAYLRSRGYPLRGMSVTE